MIDLSELSKKLLTYLESSEKILVTAHISPDPDAICSVLLLGRTLKTNFPEKKIEIVLEEKPTRDLSFLKGYAELKYQPLLEALQAFEPDLLILTDANSYSRVSRADYQQVASLVGSNKIKTIIIDHHEEIGRDSSDIYINDYAPATVQTIYQLFFEQLKMPKPEGQAEITLLGIVSDSLRFKYDNPQHKQTFRIVSDLLDAGASIEELENRLDRYNHAQMQVLAHLASNIRGSKEGYSYSYIDDDFTQKWLQDNQPAEAFKTAAEIFVSQFIRNFENNKWGFIIYPEFASGQGVYSASFRSLSGVKDVSEIARKLGGGGHKGAAGTKLQASNIQQALEMVKKATILNAVEY